MKEFIVVGGNFLNTGAEAMTYVTVCALRSKYPDCKIYMISEEKVDRQFLTFKHISIDDSTVKYLLDREKSVRYWLRFVYKKIKRNSSDIISAKKLKLILQKCDGMFDISGYALSSQWGVYPTECKINMMNLMRKFHIPVFLMPQSFGPFDYKDNGNEILSKLKQSLLPCKAIFARESEGYGYIVKLLEKKENVYLSTDMVLETPNIDYSLVYHQIPNITEIALIDNGKGNVAIIPNMRTFEHGNKEDIISFYTKVISKLKGKKNIYLIAHSREDVEACITIKKNNEDQELIIIQEAMNCFVFESLIQKFDFAIASRYHSIVHAYKNGVPCIVLGWATKYKELAKTFDQERYMFDVRNLQDNLLPIIDSMTSSFEKEKIIISSKLNEIQKNNCFSFVTAK